VVPQSNGASHKRVGDRTLGPDVLPGWSCVGGDLNQISPYELAPQVAEIRLIDEIDQQHHMYTMVSHKSIVRMKRSIDSCISQPEGGIVPPDLSTLNSLITVIILFLCLENLMI
jgi:hypothetical protein